MGVGVGVGVAVGDGGAVDTVGVVSAALGAAVAVGEPVRVAAGVDRAAVVTAGSDVAVRGVSVPREQAASCDKATIRKSNINVGRVTTSLSSCPLKLCLRD